MLLMDSKITESISRISNNTFSNGSEIEKDSLKELRKCINRYEELMGDFLVKFSDLKKDVELGKKFLESNPKYKDIPLASKVYVYSYKNKNVIIVVSHKEKEKDVIDSVKFESNFKDNKIYYLSSLYTYFKIGNPVIKSFLKEVEKMDKDNNDIMSTESESLNVYSYTLMAEGATLDATVEIIAPIRAVLKSLLNSNKLVREKKYDEAIKNVNDAKAKIDKAKENIMKLKEEANNSKSSKVIGNALPLLMSIFKLIIIWIPKKKLEIIKNKKYQKVKKVQKSIMTAGIVINDIKTISSEYKNNKGSVNIYFAKLLRYLILCERSLSDILNFIEIEKEVDIEMEKLNKTVNKKESD